MKKIIFDDKTITELFGSEDAVSEPIDRLKEYYFKNDTFESVTAELPIRLLVGHKGTGKSALFKVAISEETAKGNLPILIRPDDIAEIGKSADEFLLKVRQWKWGLNKIIGEKVFEEFGVQDKSTLAKVKQFGVKLMAYALETARDLNERVSLEPTKKALIEGFLKNQKIVVYIDDLDRGWEGTKDDIVRISTLLNAIRDLSGQNPGLLFKLSLRSDVYYQVRTSDESTDKIEGSVVWCRWTNHEIFVLLIKRVQTFLGNMVDEKKLLTLDQKDLQFYLDDIMERRFQGRGRWSNIPMHQMLMTVIRRRPRDIVKLLSLAAHQAKVTGANLISTAHFQAVFEEYSQGRIQDTINEYRLELPKIDRLLLGMKPSRQERRTQREYSYTTAELKKKLNNLQESGTFMFYGKKPADAQDLIHFLYKINFLTARKKLETGEIQRKYFEENRYLSSPSVDFGYDWEVHPAFRWALQPDDIDSIYDRLEL